MKKVFCFLTFTVLWTIVFGKNFDGYVITRNNDTMKLMIKAPTSRNSKAFRKIETLDSIGNVTVYDSSTIIEYGYVEKSMLVKYRLKPLKNGQVYFLKVIADGKLAAVYYDPVVGYAAYGSPEIDYTFEKNDSVYLFLKNYDKLSTFINKLTSFYKEFPGTSQLIENKFSSRREIEDDIKEIINTINK